MDFKQFLLFLYSDAGRAAFGALVWGVVGWFVEYLAQKKRIPELGNDDKRVISIVAVAVFTVLIQIAAIYAGYANNTIEGWFRVFSEIGMTAFTIFTITKLAENKQKPDPNDGVMVETRD